MYMQLSKKLHGPIVTIKTCSIKNKTKSSNKVMLKCHSFSTYAPFSKKVIFLSP